MSIPQFQNIFYPNDKPRFDSFLPDVLDGDRESRIVIMPHASLEFINELIAESLNHLKPSKKFLILAPTHSTNLVAGIYDTAQESFNSVYGPVKLGSFDEIMTKDEDVDREYTFELVINALAKYYPDATFYPVLCAANSKKDLFTLKSLISSSIFDGFSIIVSGNLTASATKAEIDRAATLLTDMLSKREPLLDMIRRGHITSCMAYILEALSVIPEPITFTKYKCGTYTGRTLDTNKGDGSIWFASGKFNNR